MKKNNFAIIILASLCFFITSSLSFAEENGEMTAQKRSEIVQAYNQEKSTLSNKISEGQKSLNQAVNDPTVSTAINNYRNRHAETNSSGCNQYNQQTCHQVTYPSMDSSTKEGRDNIIKATQEEAANNANLTGAQREQLQQTASNAQEMNQNQKKLDRLEQDGLVTKCDDNGSCKVYQVDENGDVSEFSNAASSKECAPVAARAAKYSGCLFCPLFEKLFEAASSMTSKSANALALPFANLLAIGMALFIAYETLKLVASFTQQDVRKYWNTIAPQFFKMLLTYLFLTHMSEFYNYFINPMLLAGFEFGEKVSGMGITISSSEGNAGSELAPEIGTAITEFVTKVQERIAQVVSLGSFLMCFSFDEGKEGVMPAFSIWLVGIVLLLTGLVILISFGFLLIDAVVQLGIFGALAPFVIASWPFKITKKYVSAGWAIFSGVFLTFAMAGVTLAVVVTLLETSISDGATLEELTSVADLGDADELKSKLNSGSKTVLLALACAIIAFRLTGKISTLVSKFGGDAGPGIGSDMGAQAMHAGKRVVGSVAQAGGAIAKATGITDVIDDVKENVTKGLGALAAAPVKAPIKLFKAAAGSQTASAAYSRLKNSKFGQSIANAQQKVEDFKENAKTKVREVDQGTANKIKGVNPENSSPENKGTNGANAQQNINTQNMQQNPEQQTAPEQQMASEQQVPQQTEKQDPTPQTQEDRIATAEQSWQERVAEENISGDPKQMQRLKNEFMYKTLAKNKGEQGKYDYNAWKDQEKAKFRATRQQKNNFS